MQRDKRPGVKRKTKYQSRTAGFVARQVQDDGLNALPGRGGVGSPRPAEVAERRHGFPGEVVGGEPVVVHHGEGQTREPVSVLFGTHVAAGGQTTERTNDDKCASGGFFY